MKPNLSLILRLLSNIMAIVYVVAGLFLLFSEFEILSIDRKYKIILGITLLLYGFFRIYRAFNAKLIPDEK